MLECFCTMTFSRLEVLTFLGLLGVSVGWFWRRFRVVVKKIRQAKPDVDFQLVPVGKRVRDFVWEVLLQGIVVRERPLSNT